LPVSPAQSHRLVTARSPPGHRPARVADQPAESDQNTSAFGRHSSAPARLPMHRQQAGHVSPRATNPVKEAAPGGGGPGAVKSHQSPPIDRPGPSGRKSSGVVKSCIETTSFASMLGQGWVALLPASPYCHSGARAARAQVSLFRHSGTRHLALVFVIPGRAFGAGPESITTNADVTRSWGGRATHDTHRWLWIPGSMLRIAPE